jgi:iron complex outermembrane receptor protein
MFRKTRLSLAVGAAFSAGLVGVAPQVSAQQTLERVEITGSAIRRTEVEGSLPVQTITRDEINKSGVTTVQELLLQVPAIATMGGTQTSEGAGLATYGNSTASLRGLGDNRTLVLLNGRRLAVYAGRRRGQPQQHPAGAIERVEILTDGASAVYGSDAIAGVINFILTRNYQGFEASATYGSPTQSGGGENYRVSLLGGYGDIDKDRFNLTAGFAWERQNNLWAKDRDFAKTGNVEPFLFSGRPARAISKAESTRPAGIRRAFVARLCRGSALRPLRLRRSAGGGIWLRPDQHVQGLLWYDPGYDFCAFDSAAFLNLIPTARRMA